LPGWPRPLALRRLGRPGISWPPRYYRYLRTPDRVYHGAVPTRERRLTTPSSSWSASRARATGVGTSRGPARRVGFAGRDQNRSERAISL